MSERRRILSRPRTRVYDCNYNLGERYYKPVVDSLDRKYGGGGVADRLISSEEPPKRRSPFESRPTRASAANDIEDDFDIVSSMQRLKSARAARQELEDELDNLASERSIKKRSAALNAARESILEDDLESAVFGKKKSGYFQDKLLDTVGVNNKLQKSMAEETISSFKKKAQTAIDEFEDEVPRMTKWTALKAGSISEQLEESVDEKAARDRARKSRARLADLESEMDALAERGAARDKRIQDLRALLAESTATAEEASRIEVKQRVSKTEKKVTF